MLNCYGIIGIPKDVQINEHETTSGYYLNFDVMSQDQQDRIWHRYKATLWVPKGDKAKWIDLIKPRSIGYIERAHWSSKKGSNGYISFLRLDHKNFHIMETPLWIKNGQ
jgi:hypothetical protein